MDPHHERLIHPQNIIWAFQKARYEYSRGDGLFNLSEIASFELNLEANLEQIRKRLASGKYALEPISLLPQPKSPNKKTGELRMRQSFHISFADQIAWIAMINVLGPSLDLRMPSWSYGHRLYRAPVYKKSNPEESILSIGPFRHAKGQLYRTWQQSWPLYRRHLLLTARVLGNASKRQKYNDEAEERILRRERYLGEQDKLPYLSASYWSPSARPRRHKRIYWASVDLDKFYPKVTLSAVLEAIEAYSPEYQESEAIRTLVNSMLKFRVSLECVSEEMRCEGSYEPIYSAKDPPGIPTGLIVAGFLSNVAMLPVDSKVRRLVPKRHVAHFRFVDDHFFIATDFEQLVAWIKTYRTILNEIGPGPEFNLAKTEPEKLGMLLDPEPAVKLDSRLARAACEIDPTTPSRLLTRTLAQISTIGRSDFYTLPKAAKADRLEQMRTLILADLPETEVRADTRAAFAAGTLARFAPAEIDHLEIFDSALMTEVYAVGASDHGSAKLRSEGRLRPLLKKADKLRKQQRELYFHDIVTAFKKHPDKIRLLKRVVQYCGATGHPGISWLFRWLGQHPTGEPQRRYLHAYAIQLVADQIVRAIGTAFSREAIGHRRNASKAFLADVCRIKRAQIKGAPGDDFHSWAVAFLRYAFAGAASCARYAEEQRLANTLDASLREIGGKPFERFSSEEVESAAGVIFWLERRTTRFLTEEPGPIWTAVQRRLSAKGPMSAILLRMYPTALALTQDAAREIFDTVRKSDEGWLRSVLSEMPPTRRRYLVSRRSVAIKNALGSLQVPLRAVRLVDWPVWLARNTGEGFEDPRAGEWTALEIAIRISNLVEKKEVPATLIHGANFQLAEEWMKKHPPSETGVATWSWDAWRNFIARTQSGVELASHRVTDPYVANFQWRDDSDGQRAKVAAVCLILFNLLRRSFTWPAIWNVPGHFHLSQDRLLSLLHRILVSSPTTTILEATLTRRSSETWLFNIEPGFSQIENRRIQSDTKLDPPPIGDLAELRRALRGAQAILVPRQVSLLNYQPLQLTPIVLRQLTHFPNAD